LAEKEIVYVDKKGKRLDGRSLEEIRELKIKTGVLKRVSGSCYIELGRNKIIASVEGPKEVLPKHLANPYKAIVKFTYRMTSFSTSERKNPKPGRREIEISKVLGEALEESIFLNNYPNTMIRIHTEVLDSNAGTRVAALTAASTALADAGIAMRDLVTSISVGRAGGKLMVDLTKEEEDAPDAVDIPVAFMTNSKKITLLQMDGILPRKDFNKALDMAYNACLKIKEKQREALLESFG